MDMTRSRLIPAVILTAALVPAAAFSAMPTPGPVLIHAINGGVSGGHEFAAGQPLLVALRRHGKIHATRACWTPAPIDSPACGSTSAFRAAARAGNQSVRVYYNGGGWVDGGFHVTRAAAKLPGGSGTPAVPLRVTCTTRFYANFSRGKLLDELPPIATGLHVAAFYRVAAHHHVVQVAVYRGSQEGFADDSCLKPVLSRSTIR